MGAQTPPFSDVPFTLKMGFETGSQKIKSGDEIDPAAEANGVSFCKGAIHIEDKALNVCDQPFG